MKLIDVLKLIATRTDIVIYHEGDGYHFSSYAGAIAELEREKPWVLDYIVIEIQAVEFKEIHIITK